MHLRLISTVYKVAHARIAMAGGKGFKPLNLRRKNVRQCVCVCHIAGSNA